MCFVCSTIIDAALSTDASEHKSIGMNEQRSPADGFSSAIFRMASAPAVGERHANNTRQPNNANERVVSKPMPLFAPVTTATFPVKS